MSLTHVYDRHFSWQDMEYRRACAAETLTESKLAFEVSAGGASILCPNAPARHLRHLSPTKEQEDSFAALAGVVAADALQHSKRTDPREHNISDVTAREHNDADMSMTSKGYHGDHTPEDSIRAGNTDYYQDCVDHGPQEDIQHHLQRSSEGRRRRVARSHGMSQGVRTSGQVATEG